jgi:cytoskeletal protein CcmA (bactofilin family)
MLFQKKPEDERGIHSQELRSSVASIPTQRATPAPRKPDGLAPRAVIAEGIDILGCLKTDGEVQIDGSITGDVRCAHLTIGKTGAITGDIAADEIVIRGKVKGAINAQRVIIQEGAHVESDITHDRFAIEEGAFFKGSCMPNGAKEMEASDPQVVALRQVADEMKDAQTG